MIAQPNKMKKATKCCCRNDAKSTSSSMAAGGDAGGGASCGTKRGRIVTILIFPLLAAQSKTSAMDGPPMQLSQWATTTVDPDFLKKTVVCGINRARFLLYLNLAGAVAHLALAIVTLAVAGINGDVNTPLVTTHYTELGWNTTATVDPYMPVLQAFGTFSVPWTTFAFFFLSAFAHALIVICNWSQMRATDPQLAEPRGMVRGWYLVWLSSCQQPLRWIEYFFSAPVMILLIAAVGGITHVFLLIALYMLTATTMLFGHLAELMNEKDTDGTWHKNAAFARLWPSLLGWFPFVPVFVIVLWNFSNALTKAADNGREVPGFVWAIVISQVVLFSLFSFPQLILLGLKRGPEFYWIGEMTYLILSLTAKAVLGLLFIASTFAFDNLENAVTA